jgi:protein kinase C substrate 80K-H
VTRPKALYSSLVTHHNALKSLQREHKRHLEREKQLSDILNTLRHGYNPNYQDMAVLEAVRGWEYLAGLPHIGEAEREEGIDEEEEATSQTDEVEELEEGEWSVQQLEQQLDELLKVDHVSLLMEHDSYVDDSASIYPGAYLHRLPRVCRQMIRPIAHNIEAYLPDFLIPHYEALRDTLVSSLQILGIARGSSTAASG